MCFTDVLFFSILCVGFLAIVVLIKLGQRIASDSVQLTKIVLFPRTFEGALQAVTYLSLSFVCQFQLFPLQKELYRPTKPRLYLVVIASSIFAYFLYNIVAIGGYLQVSYCVLFVCNGCSFKRCVFRSTDAWSFLHGL